MSFIFGSKSEPVSSMPAWMNKAGEDTFNFAKQVADKPLTMADFPSVADLSANQKAAGRIAQRGSAQFYRPMAQGGGAAFGPPPNPDNPQYGGRPYGGPDFMRLPGAPTAIPSNITPQATARDVAAGTFDQAFNPAAIGMERVGTQSWDGGAAQRYMNPFVQSALDPAAREIERRAAQAKIARNANAVSRGAFGTERQAIEDVEGERNTQQALSDLYATGLSRAYDTGLGAFQSDMARELQAAQGNQRTAFDTGAFNEGNRLAGFKTNADVGMANLDRLLRASLANQAKDIDLGKFNAGQAEQARQFDEGAAQSAFKLNQGAGQQSFEQLMQSGALDRGIDQANLDAMRRDFIEQRDYDKSRLDVLIRALAGIPGQNSVQQVQSPSIGSQVAGLGLAGAGIAKYLF